LTSVIALFLILFLVCLSQTFLQLARELVVAELTHRLQIKLEKLALLTHLPFADGACKMVDMPGFVEGMEHVARDDGVTGEADVAEQLMVVDLAVGQALLLVVARTEERLLTLGTHKVLHMPCLAQGVHDTLLDGTPAGAADRDAHLIVASQAVQLPIHLSSIRVQLNTAGVTVEVVGVEGLALVLDVALLDDGVTLVAHVLAHAPRLLLGVTLTAQRPSLIFHEAGVSKGPYTQLTSEAVRMPAVV